jgi:HPt (histidine-containing phosphotransfer) domain-containing protein
VANTIIDESELLNRLEGDEELLRELIDMFLAECGEILQQGLDAVVHRDAAELHRTAHKLKGAVSIFRSAETTQAALALETMGREGNLTTAAEASTRLQRSIEALRNSLVALKEKHCTKS